MSGPTFEWLVLGVAVLAGVVAAVAGFGIGSLLTPLLIPVYGAKLAVALVAIPHAIATLLRLYRLRSDIATRVLKGFGLASALGSLAGAFLYVEAPSAVLAVILGVLLIAAGCLQLTGWITRIRLTGTWAPVAGVLSGVFGGLVGNQGGLRSAALLAFELTPREFVATAAAIALIVDAVRLPVYLAVEGSAAWPAWPTVLTATAGVIAGTFAGTSVLMRLSDRVFRCVIGMVLLVLGASLLLS